MTPTGDTSLVVRLEKKQERFKRIRLPGPDQGVGEFFLLLTITALKEDVYIPLSIASGKKPTGFVYQIEGTGQGTISTTDISASGDGVTQITLGTLLYAKIPRGKTATFRILVEMKGIAGKSYAVVINQISYKHAPTDARYQKFLTDIRTDTLKFQ
jgi:hypothetical protein